VDLGEPVDSRILLGSNPERSFLAAEIAYFVGFGQEAHKRETGSIESGGDLRMDPGGLRPESVIFRESQVFTLIHGCLIFSPQCHLSV